jgi:16S rRNA (guanine966-N2)-methyltransferase
MRIIAGEFRSRRIKSVPGDDVRPTPDRLRESLFSILQTRLEGAIFLDAYAGTGAVGLEAISRGAAKAVLIERNHDALEALQENVQSLGVKDRAQVIKGSAHIYLASQKADIVFIDPPYSMDKEYDRSLATAAGTEVQLVIVQHDVRRELPETQGKLQRTRTVRQGTNVLTFYAPVAAETPPDAEPEPEP